MNSSSSFEEVQPAREIDEHLMSDSLLREELTELYRYISFFPQAWTDRADYAFVTNHLVETAIRRFAHELQGRIIDV